MYNETFPLIIAPIYRGRIVIDVTTRRGTQLFRAKNDSPRRRSPGVVNQWISKDLSCDALISLYAPSLKGLPGASSNRIVRPSVCLLVCP